MKALFYCPEDQSAWVKIFFHQVTPLHLKYCNKPLLEYFIDFCVVIGIKDIRVLNNNNARDLENYFKDGTRWGVNISYSLSKPDDGIDSVIRKNSRFIADDDLMLFYGYGFLHYDKDFSYDFLKEKDSFKFHHDGAEMFYLKSTDLKATDKVKGRDIQELKLTNIDGIKTYWQLNMDILQGKAGNYVLPGYNNEAGIYLGQNVSYPPSASLQKPFIIGNNVSIKQSVLLGENAIIGNSIIIDQSTTIKQSIIYDEAYIGSNLELINKIVRGNRLIDPLSGEYINLVDKFFLSSYKPGITKSLFLKFIHTLISLILILVYFIPFLVFGFFAMLGSLDRKKAKIIVDKDGNNKECLRISGMKKHFFGALFNRFSLDKYPLYFKSFCGFFWLAGNQILPANNEGHRILDILPDYKPGVLSYSELLRSDINDPNYYNHEMYYLNHSNSGMDFKLIVNFLWSRFWK